MNRKNLHWNGSSGGPSEADPTFETAELDSAVETDEHEPVIETDEFESADSMSQVSAHVSTTSSALARRIEMECKRVELEAIHDRDLANAEADAAAVAIAKAKADSNAKFRIEEAKLDAEEKLNSLSERYSSTIISSSSRVSRKPKSAASIAASGIRSAIGRKK